MTGTSPAKSVSAERYTTGSTVLTVDLGNSRHKLLCLSICVILGMSPMGREQGLNESIGSAPSMPTWRVQPRAAAAYPHG